MSARIAWSVAGIVAVGAVVVWMVMRDHGGGNPEGRTATGSAAGAGTVPAAQDESRTGSSTPQPSRSIPPVRVRPPPPKAEEVEEERDEAWAAAQEAELAPRIEAISIETGTGIALACGTATCRLTIEGADTGAIGAALSRLEEPGGLYGTADSMKVGALRPTPEGRVRVVVDATFDR